MGDRIHPVILCGGHGSRLWPLSRPDFPKQFLRLGSEQSLLRATIERLAIPSCAAPLIACGADQRPFLENGSHAVLLEPCPRGTALISAIAAWHIRHHTGEDDPLILLIPADHAVAHPNVLHRALTKACEAARDGRWVCFGIEPEYPETGYGYIEGGEKLAAGVRKVRRFTEKPGESQARSWIASGRYHWNSGMFLVGARQMLEQFDRWAPTVSRAARKAWEGRRDDPPFHSLPRSVYGKQPILSVDHAIMEKTDRAAVVETKKMGWSDLGTWEGLWRLLQRRGIPPLASGPVAALECDDTLIVANPGHSVAALGLKNLVVVATDDVTMVADRKFDQDIPKLHAAWRKARGTDAPSRAEHHRPWGRYRVIDVGEDYLVKRITVDPGGILSLQYHHHRDEHWVVVAGCAHATKGTESIILEKNQSIDIPRTQRHRLHNRGSVPLEIIEVQSGPILREDDIVRLEDAYGRIDDDSSSPSIPRA